MNFYELGALLVCVDEYDEGRLSGRVYSTLKDEPVEFTGIIMMLKVIENIFSEADSPHATTRCRTFGKMAPQVRRIGPEPRNIDLTTSSFRGNLATFALKIIYRQNATWQGTLQWMEKGKEENFRSVLELLMLLDSAL